MNIKKFFPFITGLGGCSKEIRAISATTYYNLEQADNFDDFLETNNDNMIKVSVGEYLLKLLKEKGLKRSYIIRETNLNNSYVYEIFKGDKIPSRDKLIAITIAMHLSEEETQRALKLAGHSELYPRKKRDAAILFAIKHGFDIDKTERLLIKHDLPILLKD